MLVVADVESAPEIHVSKCSVCGEPAHASETNELGVCTTCLAGDAVFPAPCGLSWRSLDTDHNRTSTTYTVQVEWDVVISDTAFLHRLSVLTVRCHDDDCENQETALLFGEMPTAEDITELTEDVQRMHEERSTCYRDEAACDWRTAKQVIAALEAQRDARGAA